MGKYSVPEDIRAMKPKGTMVKNISDNYYVYEYRSVTDSNGRRKTVMGKMIGKIQKDIGYIPNSSLLCDEEISTLEYGQYALAISNSQDVYDLLKECFNPLDAARIYTAAIIHFANGFTYLKDVHKHYDMSYLSLKFPQLKMGYTALSGLYDNLGRRQGNVLEFERKLLELSSRELAIDGHAINSLSECNDLSEKGNKFFKTGSEQMNLMMAYDINTGKPLISKIYAGGNLDKVSVSDFLNQIEMKDLLFIVDAGFYSNDNMKLFTSNGNSYIIPLSPNLVGYRKVSGSNDEVSRFVYQSGRKKTVVEYRQIENNGRRVFRFCDINQAALQQADYLSKIEAGKKNYTIEKFNEYKDRFGVIVLETNIHDKSAKEIYELYKKRWSIETFYDYFKNRADYNTIKLQDYYMTQGLAFIMLVSSLIYRNMQNAAKSIKGKSLDECMLDARTIKITKRYDNWVICNCKTTLKEMMAIMGADMVI